MNICFDFDGVLRHLDLGIWRHSLSTGYAGDAILHARSQTPLLNPAMMALPEDNLYCVTGCLSLETSEEKSRFLKHFYGNRIELTCVLTPNDIEGRAFEEEVAHRKFELLKKLKIDVYFDDNPTIVRALRKLAEEEGIQTIKFVKYGGWIEPYEPEK